MPTAIATGGGRVDLAAGTSTASRSRSRSTSPSSRLAELGSISERRTALLVDAAAERRPARRSSAPAPGSTGHDALPVHRRGPRVARTRCWPTRHRPTPSRPAPTRRTTSRWARSPGASARTVAHHVEQILAIELLCAARALDLRLASIPGTAPGAGVAAAHAAIRDVVRPWDGDREPGADLEAIVRLVREGRLSRLAAPGNENEAAAPLPVP